MREYPSPANRRGGKIAQWLLAKTWQSSITFPLGVVFLFTFIEESVENLKNA
jgi:hypothetical protein